MREGGNECRNESAGGGGTRVEKEEGGGGVGRGSNPSKQTCPSFKVKA